MKRRARRTLFVSLVLGTMLLAGQSLALAGPKGPPNYGVQNPQGLEGCMHPDPVKCFVPGWSDGEEVHIVADPITVVGAQPMPGTEQHPIPYPEDVKGTITFWCQSNIGFKYQIWVEDLEPQAAYTVMVGEKFGPWEARLGTFRTDPSGYGVLNGVYKTDTGGLWFIQVLDADGDVVYDTWLDPQGFGVYPTH